MIIPLKNIFHSIPKIGLGLPHHFSLTHGNSNLEPPFSPRLKVRKPSTIAWSAAHRRPFSGPRRNDSTIETNHTSVCHGQDGMHGESEKVTWKNIWDWNGTSNNRMYHGCWIYIYSWMISRSSVKIIVRTMFISSETDRSPSLLEKFGIVEKICDSTRKERKFSHGKMQESHGFYQYTQKNVWVSAGLQFEPQQKLGFDMMCIINQQDILV